MKDMKDIKSLKWTTLRKLDKFKDF